MKKKYVSPMLMMTGGHEINFGDSQGTQSGDSPYTWESQEDEDRFYTMFGDEALEDMDRNRDNYISHQEFADFWEEYGG